MARPVSIVASGAPAFVSSVSGPPATPVTDGAAPPITLVSAGAPPICLVNDDGRFAVEVISGLQALYDPSDLTSIYQSRTGGSTGAVDSVVGIMLDKSKMGGQTAAAFIAGQSNIWVDASATVIGETEIVSAGVFRIYSSAGVNSYIRVAGLLTAGLWYEVRFTIDSIATLGAGVQITDVGEIFTTTGAKTSTLKASATTAFIKRVSGATDIQISNVQYRLIPGYHPLAPSDAARPILRAGYVDFDGVGDVLNAVIGADLGASCSVYHRTQAGANVWLDAQTINSGNYAMSTTDWRKAAIFSSLPTDTEKGIVEAWGAAA